MIQMFLEGSVSSTAGQHLLIWTDDTVVASCSICLSARPAELGGRTHGEERRRRERRERGEREAYCRNGFMREPECDREGNNDGDRG